MALGVVASSNGHGAIVHSLVRTCVPPRFGHEALLVPARHAYSAPTTYPPWRAVSGAVCPRGGAHDGSCARSLGPDMYAAGSRRCGSRRGRLDAP